jgi:hypothetical protein
LAKVLLSEFISTFETEWNWIAYLSQSFATGSSMYQKIVKDLIACQEVKCDCLLALFAQAYEIVVEILSLTDHRTYHEAKKHILNLHSNHLTPFGTSSKNSKPKHEAKGISS